MPSAVSRMSCVGHGRRADFLQTVFQRISYENMGQNRVFVALERAIFEQIPTVFD